MFFIFVGAYSVYDAGTSFPTTTTTVVIVGGIGFVLGGIYLLSSQSLEARFYLKNAYMSDAKQLNHFYETFPEFRSSSFVKQSLSLKV